MKITIIAIGKTGAKYLQDGIEIYTKRISYYVPFEFKENVAVSTEKQEEEVTDGYGMKIDLH